MGSSVKHSTVSFASHLEGNMGATLTPSWIGSREGDITTQDEIQYSEYPFHTGIAEINRVEGREEMKEA